MRKKLSLLVILIAVILIILGLTKQISEALNAGKRLDASVEEVGKLQDENKKLQKRLIEVQKYDFIEEIARNKLNLSKKDETVIIIPQEEISKVLALNRGETPKPEIPNWQGWLKLFFN